MFSDAPQDNYFVGNGSIKNNLSIAYSLNFLPKTGNLNTRIDINL